MKSEAPLEQFTIEHFSSFLDGNWNKRRHYKRKEKSPDIA
jgi:hypothetical protein